MLNLLHCNSLIIIYNNVMILQILLVLLLGMYAAQTDSATVKIKYLQGQARLNDRSCGWDFLFTCSVNGAYLVWVVNDTGLRVIHQGQVPIVFNEALLDFNYTSTVLSSRAEGGGLLVSILMVSVSSNTNINVRCVSDNGSDVTSNRAMTGNTVLQRNSENGVVSMNHLWEDRHLVQGANSTTTCYICGVNSDHLIWETNTKDHLGLISEFNLGKQVTFRAADENSLRLQTIFFARSPKNIVALFLVMDSSVSEVSCRTGSTIVSSSELLRNEPMYATSMPNTEDDNVPTSLPSYTAATTNGNSTNF